MLNKVAHLAVSLADLAEAEGRSLRATLRAEAVSLRSALRSEAVALRSECARLSVGVAIYLISIPAVIGGLVLLLCSLYQVIEPRAGAAAALLVVGVITTAAGALGVWIARQHINR